ncbi:MAG: carbamoyltransferase C-terminal domain-containing protein [Candidatus Uhrbacteria bacterium]
MNIIGFNLSKTAYDLPLDNGGACLIVDGEVRLMINEERLTREQYAPGFAESIRYILKHSGLHLDDIDLFVASSCLEPLRNTSSIQRALTDEGFIIPLEKIRVCGHHESHAHSAYFPSGFDEAIVLVADGDGNTLSGAMEPNTDNVQRYWMNAFEHTSYYVARGNVVTLLEQDPIGIGINGLGGAYRYFTYFCGFPGYKYAGKLMGLSAYGMARNRFANLKLFELNDNNQIQCTLPDTDRLDSSKTVERWFHKRGVRISARAPHEPIRPEHEDAAWLIQRELSEILVKRITAIVKKTGITKLCIAGGVGLNAVTNTELLTRAGITDLFIQPAAGDSGQALGNAYVGVAQHDTKYLVRKTLSIYLGAEYADKDIRLALEKASAHIDVRFLPFPDLVKEAASAIANNHIIGWFQGRSEIGPRALGNRSILANPRNTSMKEILNTRVKHRELFRPFAPSVTAEAVHEWFNYSESAPYMILNATVRKPDTIPATTHVDGTARLQTVTARQNPRYYALLVELGRHTGVPIALNTSFNDNEAIVETPEDALTTFLRTKIDVLYIGNYVVTKKRIVAFPNPAELAYREFRGLSGAPRYIACFGKTFLARDTKRYEDAMEVGRIVVRAGFGILHGGYSGVMEAVSRGADEIIHKDRTKNPFWNIGVPLSMADTELTRSSTCNLPAAGSIHERIQLLTTLPDAFVLLSGGGFGTLTEALVAFHANQLASKFGGKIRPIIFVGDEWKSLMQTIEQYLDLHHQQNGAQFTHFISSHHELEHLLNTL